MRLMRGYPAEGTRRSGKVVSAMDAVGWLIVVLFVLLLALVAFVVVRRRRRAGGVFATRRKR